MRLRVDVRDKALKAKLSDRPKLYRAAMRSALTKEGRRLEKNIINTVATKYGIRKTGSTTGKSKTLRKVRGRFRRKPRSSATWIGYNPIGAGYIKGQMGRTSTGAFVGQHRFPGAFVATMPVSGYRSVWKRTGKKTRTGKDQIKEMKIDIPGAKAIILAEADKARERYRRTMIDEINKRLKRS